MRFNFGAIALTTAFLLGSCAQKPNPDASKETADATAGAKQAGGPHAFVHLKDGSKVPGTIVASSQTDMVVAGDDGIERKIPLSQIKSVEYADASKSEPASQARSEAPAPQRLKERSSTAPQQKSEESADHTAAAAPQAARTYELPAGSDLSVRTNEAIDSGKAAEGQTFDAQVTRDVTDAAGAVVIPKGSEAHVMIKSASKGGRFRGASDLVLDLQSVSINGRSYTLNTVDVSQKGKSGLGANKRTATYTGGGAALGAIIGAIAGGGKGAAIGAGAGAGAGALTQVLTKGKSIKVPAESVLTFRLDQPLRVSAVD